VHYEGFLGTTGESFVKSAEEGRGTGEPAVVVAGRGAEVFFRFFFSFQPFSFPRQQQ
jgi:hypothetical protein